MTVARVLVVVLVLAALQLPVTVGAGGRGFRGAPPPGLSIRGKVSNGQANAGAIAVGAGALMFGAGAAWYSGEAWRDDPAILVVDASPPDAHVYLDGQLLGVAGELIARGLSISFGPHVVHVVAPGFRPWAERFVADGAFPTRIRATLTRRSRRRPAGAGRQGREPSLRGRAPGAARRAVRLSDSPNCSSHRPSKCPGTITSSIQDTFYVLEGEIRPCSCASRRKTSG